MSKSILQMARGAYSEVLKNPKWRKLEKLESTGKPTEYNKLYKTMSPEGRQQYLNATNSAWRNLIRQIKGMSKREVEHNYLTFIKRKRRFMPTFKEHWEQDRGGIYDELALFALKKIHRRT